MYRQLKAPRAGFDVRSVQSVLNELLSNPRWNRRTERRLPFFGPVEVSLPGILDVRLSAFLRDISAGGMGLVHLMPLKEGQVVLHVKLPEDREAGILSSITWCRDYDNGWYASGGRLLSVVSYR